MSAGRPTVRGAVRQERSDGQIRWGKSGCKGPEAGLRWTCRSNGLETSPAIVKGGKWVEGHQRVQLEGAWGQRVQVQLRFCSARRWFFSLPQSSHLHHEGLDGAVLFQLWLCHFLKNSLVLPLGSRRTGSRLQG